MYLFLFLFLDKNVLNNCKLSIAFYVPKLGLEEFWAINEVNIPLREIRMYNGPHIAVLIYWRYKSSPHITHYVKGASS